MYIIIIILFDRSFIIYYLLIKFKLKEECVCVCERETARETDRQTDRQRETGTERHRHRQIEREYVMCYSISRQTL